MEMFEPLLETSALMNIDRAGRSTPTTLSPSRGLVLESVLKPSARR